MQSADGFRGHQVLKLGSMDLWEHRRRGFVVHSSMIVKYFEFSTSMNQVDKWDEN
jgi:hypothetical protein